MTDLFKIRNAIALHGMMNSDQLSRLFSAPLPLIEAMLFQLTTMGKIEIVEQKSSGCMSGSCKSCSHDKGGHKKHYKMCSTLKRSIVHLDHELF